jgi:hypothetical protein
MDSVIPPNRRKRVYNGNILVSETYIDFDWEQVKAIRDEALLKSDWWGLKDLTMSQAKKDYRTFLRDLPQNYETANDALDAWNEYVIPE